MPLAGVDDILKRCTDFCLRKFIEHSSVNVVHGGEFQRCCHYDMIISLASSLCPPSHWTPWRREDFDCPSHSGIYTRGCQNIGMYVHDLATCLVFN